MKCTKQTLSDVIADEIGCNDNTAQRAVAAVLDHLSRCLLSGDGVEIRGTGSMRTSFLPERPSTNPRTGDPIVAAARHRVLFRPSPSLIKFLGTAHEKIQPQTGRMPKDVPFE